MTSKTTLLTQFNFSPVITLIGFILILAGCSSSRQIQEETARQRIAAEHTPVTIDKTYRIRTGDEIEILVWEQPGFNTQTTVSSLGVITIPLVGEIRVTGMTREELERELTRGLSEYIRSDLILTVSIRSFDNLMISIFGMVTRPDNYPIVEEASIFKVLAMAGGPTIDANLQNVKIYRTYSNPQAQNIDLTRYLDSGHIDESATIYPGDIIFVPRKQNAVRDMSDFLRDVVLLFGIFRIFS